MYGWALVIGALGTEARQQPSSAKMMSNGCDEQVAAAMACMHAFFSFLRVFLLSVRFTWLRSHTLHPDKVAWLPSKVTETGAGKGQQARRQRQRQQEASKQAVAAAAAAGTMKQTLVLMIGAPRRGEAACNHNSARCSHRQRHERMDGSLGERNGGQANAELLCPGLAACTCGGGDTYEQVA